MRGWSSPLRDSGREIHRIGQIALNAQR